MGNLKRAINYVRDAIYDDNETVTVNIMLTEKCNFKCAHCFYECGPELHAAYVSDEVLEKIAIQVGEMTNDGVRVSVNLIGGEPTLNLNEFERVYERVMYWMQHFDIEVQMTTNGWWLHRVETCRRFMEIIGKYTNRYGIDDNGVSIRVSNDRYHDEFRPQYMRNGNIKHHLSDVWEGYEVLYDTIRYAQCVECGHEYYNDDIPDNEECCDEYLDIEYDTEDAFYPRPPQPEEYGEWIYVEDHRRGNSSTTIPIGRGASFGSNDKGDRGYCNTLSLTFKPDGRVSDICCSGSDVPIGTVDDDFVKLLYLARLYTKMSRPSCWSCRTLSKEWVEDNLEKYRNKLGMILNG